MNESNASGIANDKTSKRERGREKEESGIMSREWDWWGAYSRDKRAVLHSSQPRGERQPPEQNLTQINSHSHSTMDRHAAEKNSYRATQPSKVSALNSQRLNSQVCAQRLPAVGVVVGQAQERARRLRAWGIEDFFQELSSTIRETRRGGPVSDHQSPDAARGFDKGAFRQPFHHTFHFGAEFEGFHTRTAGRGGTGCRGWGGGRVKVMKEKAKAQKNMWFTCVVVQNG